MAKKTTDEKLFIMSWRNFVFLQSVLLGITNGGNLFYNNQSQNTYQIEYNDKAHKRRLNHAMKELYNKNQIKDLKKELENCKK